ncbi:DUF397 domain-containing protein [Streptomyces mirabilis]|nr:DUF397 domain-containing protein [Streptomyces mirabilis]
MQLSSFSSAATVTLQVAVGLPAVIPVRDSKLQDGPVLLITRPCPANPAPHWAFGRFGPPMPPDDRQITPPQQPHVGPNPPIPNPPARPREARLSTGGNGWGAAPGSSGVWS